MSDNLEYIHQLVQEYLKPVPLIIWGSGGTIPFGMPSMEKLKEDLELTEDGNLEKILSAIQDKEMIAFYQGKIFNLINKSDAKLRRNINTFSTQEIMELFMYFYDANPYCLNIVTTNYDCFLEYLFSYNGLCYTDGFSGKEFSEFDENRLNGKKNIINIIKAHGSLRWNEKARYSHYNKSMKAIYPSEDKYREAHDTPFRQLIRLSDQKIRDSQSFLIIGFGFNDEHLTPEIEKALRKRNSRIVVVTKHATKSARKMINQSHKFVLIEEGQSDSNQTKITYKENHGGQVHPVILEGDYWKLSGFKNMLIARD